jgi:hypothetical protein
MTREHEDGRIVWPAVAAITLVGLLLRLLAADGGLWTDEAWSMIYAEQARDPAGVFLRINHDNNHHLISLWLQSIGVHAPPLLGRAPAILAGTLMIPAAALLFARRSTAGAIAAAILFALSPIMVTYGSEARGYALMVLAALLILWLVIGSLEGRRTAATAWLIGAIALLGMLSHLTMAAPVVLLILWVYLDQRSALGARAAIPATAKLMGPALAACAAVFLFVFVAAALSQTGMQVGGYVPFTFDGYATALSDLVKWTLGPSLGPAWFAVVALLLTGLLQFIRPRSWLGPRASLYAILILGVPAVIAIERTGNSIFVRYYLCSAIGLLLLFADWIGHAILRPGVQRMICASALSLFLVLSAWRDWQIIQLKRGDPDRAFHIIAQRQPAGARVAVGGPERLIGPLVVAAKRADYPLIEEQDCARADFLIEPREPATTGLPAPCSGGMRLVARSQTTVLSGDAWLLYARDLQRSGRPVSGPVPARQTRLSGRAGVAQG